MYGKLSRMLLWVVLLASVTWLTAFDSSKETTRAMWLWQAESIQDGGQDILDYADNHRINHIYLRIDMEQPAAVYQRFILRAHENGIKVDALGGHPKWAAEGGEVPLLRFANWVVDFNRESEENEKFSGIHLDIEPYVLGEWEIDSDEVTRTYLANIEKFLSVIEQEPSLDSAIDLPFWYDHYYNPDSQEPLIQWFMGRFDQIALMAYRDKASGVGGIVQVIQEEMEWSSNYSAKIIVGVNAKPMPGEEFTTFAGKSKEKMEQALQEVTASYAGYSSFAGVAIHDYVYWSQMTQDTVNPEPTPEPEPTPDPEPEPELPTDSIRGTYIWKAEQIINESDQVLEFLQEKKVNFLYVRLDLDQPYSLYRNFVGQAAAMGIEVHAMGGHPSWGLEENRSRLTRLINYVKQYNLRAAEDEKFHGIHLDIEPYTNSEWDNNRERVLKEWASNIEYFARETKKDSDLKTSADLAVWLDRHELPGKNMTVTEWMIRTLDHISLMAFRDTAEGSNGIATVVAQEMEIADQLGKPLLISVEMKESHEGNHITFYEEGEAYMESELAKLPGLLAEYNAYQGYLIHSYDYWINAKP
ncbi:hypothetical protein QPK24_15200 [Paenibacillus polygoni]|uniref:Glycosyl hydrolase-like 10 domain-containing protein n=1 Tax=Paenibacillus polygoni TaxID=3050112 RepID=A0ABY8WZZ8_9BACL|nr:hypothetical protein [Paenibacillus polygoni]WIV17761.1 hypothetical protein QPK24_15200 [Paenibacillus polygoni]